MDSRIFKFLGSIKLAVPLLGAIALILIGATFYESSVGSATVQNLIYKSPWFGALMFLLAINLGLSTIGRYPWRGARKIGLAITHWGLVVIIAGSAAVIHLSTEGMLLVRTDGGPINQIRVEGELLEIANPDGTEIQRDIFVRDDGSVYPEKIGDLSLIGYTDSATTSVEFEDGGTVDNLAVKVQLQSDRMGQTVERWLAIAPFGYQQTDIGPAHLELVKAEDKESLQTYLQEPSGEEHEFGLLTIGEQSFDVRGSGDQILELPDGLLASVTSVWADFRLDSDNKPTSASTQFNNPALQLNLKQGDRQATWFVFARQEFEAIRAGDEIDVSVNYAPPVAPQTDYFRIVEAPNHELFYAAASSKGFKSGEFTSKESVTPGWADFRISLAERIDQARVQRQVVPVAPVKAGMMAQSGLPQFLAYGAFIGEIIAPIFIILGFFERVASFFVAMTLLVAIFTTHVNEIFALNQFGGWAIELQAFYLFGAIAIFFTGAGKYALIPS